MCGGRPLEEKGKDNVCISVFCSTEMGFPLCLPFHIVYGICCVLDTLWVFLSLIVVLIRRYSHAAMYVCCQGQGCHVSVCCQCSHVRLGSQMSAGLLLCRAHLVFLQCTSALFVLSVEQAAQCVSPQEMLVVHITDYMRHAVVMELFWYAAHTRMIP